MVGGIGLGLGYISPVSTLIKWFVDRPGMATGMAIMGFGGGAMIGGPLAVQLLDAFDVQPRTRSRPRSSRWAAIYFVFMMLGAFPVRLPADGWRRRATCPRGAGRARDDHDARNLTAADAIRTPQFWLLWVVLC